MSAELKSHLMMASVDFSRLQAFVQNLRLKTGADGALFRYLDYKDWTYPITIDCGSGLFSKRFFNEYDGGWGLNDPHIRVGVNRQLPDGHIYICSEHYSAEHRKTDPYFSEFLPSHDIKWMGGYLTHIDNQYAAGFAVVRRADKSAFGDTEKELMQPLLSVLDDSVRMLMHGQRMKLIQRGLELALERRTDFAMCIDAQGRVLWQSASAKKTTDAMKSLRVIEDKIVSRSKEGEAALNEIMEMARSSDDMGVKVTVEKVDGESTPFLCVPVRAETGRLGESGLGACVLLGEGNVSKAASPVAMTGDINSLTKTELLICEHAARGLSAPRIADAMGVQPSTVRTHLKHVHRKLKISNRSELVAMFLGSVKEQDG
ncbi:MAG: helix-turn-helix transcriptional regulator [Pseudomonadota bacterium]